MEKFKPSNYKSIEELPENRKKNFFSTKDGFIGKNVVEHDQKLMKEAKSIDAKKTFFQKLREKKTNYMDLSHDEALSEEKERSEFRKNTEKKIKIMLENFDVREIIKSIKDISAGNEIKFDCLKMKKIITNSRNGGELDGIDILFNKKIIDLNLNYFKPEECVEIIDSIINSMGETGAENTKKIALVLRSVDGIESIDSNHILNLFLDNFESTIKNKNNKVSASKFLSDISLGMYGGGLFKLFKNINSETLNRILELDRYENSMEGNLTSHILSNSDRFSSDKETLIQTLIDRYGEKVVSDRILSNIDSLKGLEHSKIEELLNLYITSNRSYKLFESRMLKEKGHHFFHNIYRHYSIYDFKKFCELPDFIEVVRNLLNSYSNDETRKEILRFLKEEIQEFINDFTDNPGYTGSKTDMKKIVVEFEFLSNEFGFET